MRTVLPIVVLVSTHLGLLDVISAQGLDTQGGADCTPTKTITLDAPSADWRMSEQQDRERYITKGRTNLSGAAIAAMVERPQTVKQLLENMKIAVDRDLLVQKRFYDTAVLMRFFAATSIAWHKPESPWASQKVASLSFEGSSFAGLNGQATFGRSHIAEHAASNSKDHNFVQGQISLHTGSSGLGIPVHAVSNVFGMPILSHRGCGDSGFGHGPSSEDSTCKGQMIYTYSKNDFPLAFLTVNQTEFTVRRDLVERRSATWDLRSAEGRQRFLCDEDQIGDISVLQREF
jgi:hypothetical protein